MSKSLNEHLRRLEEQLLDPSVRASREKLEGLLSPEFREVGRSGRFYTCGEIIDQLLNEPPAASVMASGFEVVQLSDTIALVTYRTQRPEAVDPRHTLRSSLWRLEDERWRMVFHQGTATDADASDRQKLKAAPKGSSG